MVFYHSSRHPKEDKNCLLPAKEMTKQVQLRETHSSLVSLALSWTWTEGLEFWTLYWEAEVAALPASSPMILLPLFISCCYGEVGPCTEMRVLGLMVLDAVSLLGTGKASGYNPT